MKESFLQASIDAGKLATGSQHTWSGELLVTSLNCLLALCALRLHEKPKLLHRFRWTCSSHKKLARCAVKLPSQRMVRKEETAMMNRRPRNRKQRCNQTATLLLALLRDCDCGLWLTCFEFMGCAHFVLGNTKICLNRTTAQLTASACCSCRVLAMMKRVAKAAKAVKEMMKAEVHLLLPDYGCLLARLEPRCFCGCRSLTASCSFGADCNSCSFNLCDVTDPWYEALATGLESAGRTAAEYNGLCCVCAY